MPEAGSPPASEATPSALRPAEVAERLGISAATLRRWSSRFSQFLELGEGSQDGGSHRRYSADDLATLGRVQELLEQGWTYEQVADRLALGPGAGAADGAMAESSVEPAADAEPGRSTATALVAPGAGAELSSDDLPPAARFLRDAMQAVTGTQQMILNSQQASRDMLGVMIQDNLNLKGENTSLRERMLELERELAELNRHFADTRERMEIRIRVLEDAIAKLMASQQSPAMRSGPPASGAAPAGQSHQNPSGGAQQAYPQGYPPTSYPAAGYGQQSQQGQAPAYPPPYADQPPPKRGFWARLLGG